VISENDSRVDFIDSILEKTEEVFLSGFSVISFLFHFSFNSAHDVSEHVIDGLFGFFPISAFDLKQVIQSLDFFRSFLDDFKVMLFPFIDFYFNSIL
jgi:hypothetical protein